MPERTLKLTIAALGGEGGGVLTDWLIAIAEQQSWLVQATSVPGVAQRTGSTLYYIEFFPRASMRDGREPVMALMPVAGDVDCVLASELAEAGRVIQRGLVTGRTTLISSTHRAYAISEKSALGDGTSDQAQLLELVRGQAERSILFDMQAIAERHGAVMSAVLIGALCGSDVLPFPKESVTEAIRSSGIAVATNLAAFEDAWQLARAGGTEVASAPRVGAASAALVRPGRLPGLPPHARSRAHEPLLARLRQLPSDIQPTALEGVRRAIDYQDAPYASLYLDRLERLLSLEHFAHPAGSHALTQAVAPALALWMTFEDLMRVAQLKSRRERMEKVRADIHAGPEQLFEVTEFLKPRVAELAGTLPAPLGRRVQRSRRLSRWLGKLTGGREVRSTTVSGFLLLSVVAGMRRWRRGTLRYATENERIERWLEALIALAPRNYALSVELARAQRLIKGYGDTYERGWANFSRLTESLQTLAAREDGALQLARLQEAALADEEGKRLTEELAALAAAAGSESRPAHAL